VRSVLAIAGVELRRFLKDRSNIFFVFVLPIVLVLLIGSQFGGGGPAGRVTVAGPDSELRAGLAEQLRDDGVEVSYAAAEVVREQVARARTDVGVFLTAEAAAGFEAGEDVTVETVGSSQANAAVTLQRVRTAVDRVSGVRAQLRAVEAVGVSRDQAEDAVAAARRGAAAPELVVTGPDDEVEEEFGGLGQFDLGAATQTLLFVFLSSLTGAATLIQARRYGVVRRMLSAPLSTRGAVSGQALGRLAIALVQGIWIMAGSALLFQVDWGSRPAALLVLLTFAAVAAASAMAIGALVDNEGAAAGIGVGAGLVLGALGGCMTPLEFFPDTLRTVAHITPHAWAYDAFAEVQRRGGGVVDVLPQLGVLSAMAAGMLLLASWLLRRSLDRGL
jgi:ABC-2 type transport system permease protein